VLSNCARFVVIVWVFVVLILTQSYTASLTSLLTVQQLQPTVTNVNQLIKNGEYVGYQRGSFFFGILKEMKFDTSKLKEYNSTEECDELLSKGSANGGIAAAFDEIPYMKLFLGEYCSKYTMVASIYKTDGFGFVSSLASYVLICVFVSCCFLLFNTLFVACCELSRLLKTKQTKEDKIRVGWFYSLQ
jgi:ionotropic glutamate receptor